jgi:iron-sulfur cluster assembly accessory protein
MLTITDKAQRRISELAQSSGVADTGLKLSVVSGGCSGFQYKYDLGVASPSDHVIEAGTARVIVDGDSMLFLGGCTLDYLDGLSGAGFSVRNPKASGTCGCGTSFSV